MTLPNSTAREARNPARSCRGIARSITALALAIGLASCGQSDAVPGYEELSEHVEKNPVGGGSDQWIEMRTVVGGSVLGQWERTGLIFGYLDDYEECQKAIAGMKEANGGRDYRCVPAN